MRRRSTRGSPVDIILFLSIISAWPDQSRIITSCAAGDADFFSPYRHSFVRVGACVPQVAVAEPAKNADQVLAHGRAGRQATAVALLVFPELGLSAYAIDDLLFQDAVLDEVAAQIDRLVAASQSCCRCLSSARRCGSRAGSTIARVVIHRGRLLGVVPKIFLPNYREFYERRHFTSGEGVRGATIAIGGHEAPFGIDLLFRRTGRAGSPSMSRSARIFWVPQPPSALGARGRRRDPAQPVGQQHHDRQGGDAAPAVRLAIGALRSPPMPIRRPGPANRPPTSPGTARPASSSWASRSPRPSASARARHGGRRCRSRPHPPGADAHQHLRRLRPARAGRGAAVPHGRLRVRTRPAGSADLRRRVERFPFVPSRSGDAARQLLRGLQHPGSGAGAAPARDRPQEAGDRRLRRPRFDAGADRLGAGDGPARPAAHQRPRLHPAGLRDRQRDQGAMPGG